MADKIYGDENFELPDWLVGKKYKEQRQKFDFNQEELDKFKDPNYKPKSILERFTENPDYMEQPTLTPLTLPRRDDFDSSDLKMFPSIPGSDNAIGDEAALISAFANTQADKVRKERADKEAKAEKEKFVPRDTVLGRIFDKRVREGEELSNNEKAFALIRNASRNLLERREIGGKEGTDTLSRILGPGGGVEEGLDEIKTLETASESKKAAAVDKALERRKKQLDYDTGLANIAKTYYDMSGNADATTLQKNAEYAAQMAVSSGQIGAEDAAAFISQYLRLDQIGANVLASQLDSLQEQIFTADPDEQEAIKQQIADINNQIKIRGSGQSTGTTESNDIPYGSLLE